MNPESCQYCIQVRSPGPLYQLEYIPRGAAWLSGEVDAESACDPRPKSTRGGSVWMAVGVAVGASGGVGDIVGSGGGGERPAVLDVAEGIGVGPGPTAEAETQIHTVSRKLTVCRSLA
jgi:hypothetical protein